MARPKRDTKKTTAENSPPKKVDKRKAPAKTPVVRNAGVRKQPARQVRGNSPAYRLGLQIAQPSKTPKEIQNYLTGLGPQKPGPSTQPGTGAGGKNKDKDKDKDPGKQLQDDLDKASVHSSENSSFWAHTLPSDEAEKPMPLPSQARHNAYLMIRPGLESLKAQIRKFANDFFTFSTTSSERNLLVKSMLQRMSPELRRYIGCIVQGKAKGVEGWMKVLCTSTLRRVLLAGIIGRVLIEHVFMSLYFGADEDQEEVIRSAELDSLMNTEEDAITRANKRAKLIEVYEWEEPRPPLFEKACIELTLKLQTLLDPLLDANPAYKDSKDMSIRCTRTLFLMVRKAAEVAHSIRADGTALYHFKHIIKGDKFDPMHQEAINLKGALKNKPTSDSEETDTRRMVLTCMIVLFPECIMYRPGRGDVMKKNKELTIKQIEDIITRMRPREESTMKGRTKRVLMQRRLEQQRLAPEPGPGREPGQPQQGGTDGAGGGGSGGGGGDGVGGGSATGGIGANDRHDMGPGYRSKLVDKGDVLIGWSNESTVSRAQKGKGKTMAHEVETYIEFEDLKEEDIPMTWMDRGRETCAPQ